MVYWASAEEIYIAITTDGLPESRYIYPGNSGMGIADGYHHLLSNGIEMFIFGSLLGIFSWVFLFFLRGHTAEQGAAANP